MAVRRAAAPRAALVTFEATRTVSSEPFEANEAKLKQWFGESDAVAALCSMADEFKERSKTNLLEHAYQRVLEDTKKSDKAKY